MKAWLMIGIVAASSALAQQVQIESPVPPKPASLNTNVLATPGQKPKEPIVKYSGLAKELKNSTNRWKFFSLRKPADPKADEQAVIYETRTQSRPVKLFSIDF